MVMDKRDLINSLSGLARQPMHDLSADFEQGVWREIRSRKTASVRESVWGQLVTTFLRPGWAVSATAVTLLVSVGFGAFGKPAPRSANRSLNLDVFSVDAPALPSTLLAHTR
jgi:hypothetical protein